jgi:hypothetical protein
MAKANAYPLRVVERYEHGSMTMAGCGHTIWDHNRRGRRRRCTACPARPPPGADTAARRAPESRTSEGELFMEKPSMTNTDALVRRERGGITFWWTKVAGRLPHTEGTCGLEVLRIEVTARTLPPRKLEGGIELWPPLSGKWAVYLRTMAGCFGPAECDSVEEAMSAGEAMALSHLFFDPSAATLPAGVKAFVGSMFVKTNEVTAVSLGVKLAETDSEGPAPC